MNERGKKLRREMHPRGKGGKEKKRKKEKEVGKREKGKGKKEKGKREKSPSRPPVRPDDERFVGRLELGPAGAPPCPWLGPGHGDGVPSRHR